MSVRFDDPLSEPLDPDRVYYANGILLDDGDFAAEQTYHRSRMARLLAYLHGSGTVAGLEVLIEAENPQELRVAPGLAVDRLGRLIEIPRSWCLPLDAWFAAQAADPLGQDRMARAYRATDGTLPDGVVVDVFVKFATCERGKTPSFGSGNADATDAFAPARLRDSFQLELRIRDQDDPLPVPESDFPSLNGLSAALRRERVMEYKLQQGWREGTLWGGAGGVLNHQGEHLQDQDGTEVMLARLRVPATEAPLEFDPNVAVAIDNSIRRLVFSTEELAWINGIQR
ncbi:MAG: hypothetical protein V2I66_10515 [Halieaceae bacterium]|jgi:hypothetical protein|nr:hypothetical protein [Halieaceae bacterium]